jgi:hypothetical protein
MESSIDEKVICLPVYSKPLYFSSLCYLNRLLEDSNFFINEKIYFTELRLPSFLKNSASYWLVNSSQTVAERPSALINPRFYCVGA